MKRIVTAVLFALLTLGAARAQDSLRRGFASPPPDCRPGAFLDWMGGMISRDGLTRDMEALHAAGIGGVMIMQLPDQLGGVVQWPFRDYPGKVKCLSDEWFAMMSHVIGEADRLGMTVATLSSPGWSHVGGPWIKPEQGLKVLGGAITKVKGPAHYEGVPERAPATSEAKPTLPAWSRDAEAWKQKKESWGDWYQDVAVVAMPEPGAKGAVALEKIIDLTGKMDAGGKLAWDVPDGEWRIVRFGVQTYNGPNYPAPVEAAGLESDRMDPAATRAALDPYIGRIAREAKAKGYKSFIGFDTDSYESGMQNFSADFPAEFKKRMGYDCTPWLPAWLDRKLVIGSGELTARFRRDAQQVVSDLWIERFYGEIRRFAEENGLQWMVEPYFKLTIDWRTVAARSHAPGAEFWVRDIKQNDIIKDLIGPGPDSAALYGQKVVWAESFTARPDGSAWRNDPWLLKPYGDAAYCRGINHFVMHGFVHNPFGDNIKPGLSMGFWGTQFNRNLTWWPYAGAFTSYLARCQFMLRQGEPVADVLAYPPRTEHIPGPTLECAPYKQVVLNEESLMRLKVKDGRLEVRPGVSYAALALTPPRMMAPVAWTPEGLAKIKELIEAGATVIGSAPAPKSASLMNYPQCDAEMARLVNELWGAGERAKAGVRSLGQGRVIWGRPIPDVLGQLTGGPDCEFKGASGGDLAAKFDFTHRHTPEAEIYFVANLGDTPLDGILSLRGSGNPELWDPVTGVMRSLEQSTKKASATQIAVHFEPRQSFFIILGARASSPAPETQTAAKTPANFPILKPIAEIEGSWDVAFDPKWGGPASMRFEELYDWTRCEMDGIKFYSGKAVYKKTFDLPQSAIPNPKEAIYLDLGLVKNLAKVRLNGHDLGILWCAPWRVEASQYLKPKGNELEIEVVNTWVNRIIGDEQEPPDAEYVALQTAHGMGGYTTSTQGMALKDLPDWLIEGKPRPSKGRYTFINWQYYPKDAPLLPSGLLGPVRIMTESY